MRFVAAGSRAYNEMMAEDARLLALRHNHETLALALKARRPSAACHWQSMLASLTRGMRGVLLQAAGVRHSSLASLTWQDFPMPLTFRDAATVVDWALNAALDRLGVR